MGHRPLRRCARAGTPSPAGACAVERTGQASRTGQAFQALRKLFELAPQRRICPGAAPLPWGEEARARFGKVAPAPCAGDGARGERRDLLLYDPCRLPESRAEKLACKVGLKSWTGRRERPQPQQEAQGGKAASAGDKIGKVARTGERRRPTPLQFWPARPVIGRRAPSRQRRVATKP
jgi:hypothetical protein